MQNVLKPVNGMGNFSLEFPKSSLRVLKPRINLHINGIMQKR
ncbi:hypothetical protein V6Z11_A06G210200 [Gossypium hirsutum]